MLLTWALEAEFPPVTLSRHRAWRLDISHNDLRLTGPHGCDQRVSLINGHFRNLNWRYLPYIRPIFEAYVYGNIPAKYGQKYGTNVPPSVGS